MASAELPPISQLPWAIGLHRFAQTGAEVRGAGACCLFVVDDAIPVGARAGYAALVIAYARAGEPVTILSDGAAALLIRNGGVSAGRIAARRLLDKMSSLGLRHTLRAGVAPLISGDIDHVIAVARALALATRAGEVAVEG